MVLFIVLAGEVDFVDCRLTTDQINVRLNLITATNHSYLYAAPETQYGFTEIFGILDQDHSSELLLLCLSHQLENGFATRVENASSTTYTRLAL